MATPTLFELGENTLLSNGVFFMWFIGYIIYKLAFRVFYKLHSGKCSWDMVCLIHNLVSVFVGAYTVYNWELDLAATCRGTVSSAEAACIAMQAAHCLSDFVIYPVEMFKQPIFIFHHTILLVASLILPSCPGCVYTVFAVALAEAGSLSIAVDSEWRKTGGTSRGFKRVVIFGASRVLNLYLLYKIYLVTPSRHIITLRSMDHGEMVKLNIPLCMITSVGCSIMMLIVNGVTWYRMWLMFLKLRKKRRTNEKMKKK